MVYVSEKTEDELAKFINHQYPELKGFNRRGLYRMKQFYETYSAKAFVSSPMTQLEISDIREGIPAKITWTHHLILISRTKMDEGREFYLKLCIQGNYTVRELERQINSGVFERTVLGNSKRSTALRETHPDISNTFKDNYVFEFLNIKEAHNDC